MPSDEASIFWKSLRDHQHDFFSNEKSLWRLSLPADTVALQIEGETLYDWGGSQRWVYSSETEKVIRALCDTHGGHATLFKGGDRDGNIFHPLTDGIHAIHKNLKSAFDPAGILNPGRMYKEL